LILASGADAAKVFVYTLYERRWVFMGALGKKKSLSKSFLVKIIGV